MERTGGNLDGHLRQASCSPRFSHHAVSIVCRPAWTQSITSADCLSGDGSRTHGHVVGLYDLQLAPPAAHLEGQPTPPAQSKIIRLCQLCPWCPKGDQALAYLGNPFLPLSLSSQ